jgi:outer membrane protein
MKKLFAVAGLAMAMMFGGNQKATAQNKFGYFNDKAVLYNMPGVSKLDTILSIFQQDSLGAERNFRAAEFQRNDSTLKADSVMLVKAHIYETKMKEHIQEFYILQNWEQYAQQQMQAKQAELLQPFQEKMAAAFSAVVKEGGFTWVFKEESLYVAPPGAENLTMPVLKKLGIKIPEQQPQGQQTPARAPSRAPVKH